MIIHKIAIGNKSESFIENRLVDGFNIISSDDNNRGKTIVIQSLMYTLGNEPMFPETFNCKEYYHYVEFSIKGDIYCICRYNDSFILKTHKTQMFFDSVGELKRYWTKNLFRLPLIIKKQNSVIADPVLFFQLFFVGQDNKNTSNISNNGYYNKEDFINMIYDFCNLSGLVFDEKEIEKIKKRVSELKDEERLLKKEHKILSSKKTAANYLSAISDRETFKNKIAKMEKIEDKIAELRKDRNLSATRKSRWSTTIKELKSLNRSIDCGELRCMDCNSNHISFNTVNKSSKKLGYTFDVSTIEMRNEIISSIEDKIASYDEEISKISSQIEDFQIELQELLKDDDISLESIVSYKQEVFNASDAEKRMIEIKNEIEQYENNIMQKEHASNDIQEKRNALMCRIVSQMNNLYKQINPEGNLYFNELFTKKGKVYSGSESTMFHLVKLLSIQNNLEHDFPIIMDSFRAEDLSTPKERTVLELFEKINNQIIFTTTLKNEEIGKYDKIGFINHIDYSKNISCKLLTEESNDEFQKLLSELSINL